MHNLEFEKKIFQNNIKYIAAVDEVGRGPLAGPVVSACVLIDSSFAVPEELSLVNDSKKLTEKKREVLYEEIYSYIKNISIGIATEEEIDEYNILQASLLSMKRAVEGLEIKPEYVFVDGNMEIPKLNISQETVIKGDSRVFSIAAASIVAKVFRDRLMIQEAKNYPGYGFEKHKGYGTKNHMEGLEKLGICPLHRKSFAPIQRVMKKR